MDADLQNRLDLVRERFKTNAFSQLLGFELESLTKDEVRVGLDLLPHHLQNAGFAHGGVLATLADVVMGFAAVAKTTQGHHVLTADLRISYLHPGVGPRIWARGYALKAGRKMVFTEAEIYQETDGAPLLVCKASATMAVVPEADLKR
jgi:uncharacterized protein (TIGR00369 family)